MDRLFRIASWEWVGEDGAAVGWEGRRFLVDALRRAGGLFFVGGQSSFSFLSFLAHSADGSFLRLNHEDAL